MANENGKVKFYRGDTYDPKSPKADGVVFQNNAAKMKGTEENFAEQSKMGSVYEGKHIVGTTKADELVLTDVIDVAGQDWGNYKDGTQIQKGTDVYEILKQILSKEYYPVTTNTTPTWDCTIANPTINLTTGDTAEIGTAVSLSEVTIPSASQIKSTPGKVSGFQSKKGKGYSATIDGPITNANEIVDDWTDVNNHTDYKIALTKVGFSKALTKSEATTPEAEFATKGCKIASQDLGYIESGKNTITANITGTNWTSSTKGIAEQYKVSNLGNRSKSYKSTPLSSATGDITPTASKSVTTTGYKKYFAGCIDSTAEINSATIRSLAQNALYTDATTLTEFGSEPGKIFLIVVPSETSITRITDAFGNPIKDQAKEFGVKNGEIMTINGATSNKTYDVKVYAGKNSGSDTVTYKYIKF